MPRTRNTRRSRRHRNNNHSTPTPSNLDADPPAYQPPRVATSTSPYPVPTWLRRVRPTYDHLPRLPASSWSNGMLADRVGWALLHPDLRCGVNARLSQQGGHLVTAADRYRATADIVPALQLMEKFVLVHPGNDRFFHREVRAALDTALVRAYYIADSSLGLVLANMYQTPALMELLPPPNPAHGRVMPNPAFDGPGRSDYNVGNLYHRENEVWENLISDNTPASTASSLGWGAPHSTWDFDGNKENEPPATDETPRPGAPAPPMTPSSSMPDLDPVSDQETSSIYESTRDQRSPISDTGSDDSLSDSTARALLHWVRDRVQGNHVIFGSPETRNLLADMVTRLAINDTDGSVHVSIDSEAPLQLRFADDIVTVIEPNGIRLPMEGQA